MDQIRIENLEVFANHGVFPEENALGQKFLVSAVLYADLTRAEKSDNIKDSVHYGTVSRFIEHHMKSRTFKLLESAAQSLARELLLNTKWLEAVDIEIKKPWAPVGIPLEYVSVKIHRQWHTAYIALGSNMGDREKYLEGAVSALKGTQGCRVGKVSSWHVTAPYGVTDQEDFLNGCLKLRTLLTPEELLGELHRIENEAGRVRNLKWGPRTLDLDIIFYDDLILDTDDLCIPHADMQNRGFVLAPLCEIAPYRHHPATGRTVREMLDGLNKAK